MCTKPVPQAMGQCRDMDEAFGDHPHSRQGYLDRLRGFSTNAKLYVASSALGAMSVGISGVVFNLYMLEAGFTEDFIGCFLSISMFAAGAVALLAGMVTDRSSRRHTVVFADIVSTMALVLQYTQKEPLLLIGSQVFAGVSVVFHGVAMTPYIAGLTTDSERAHLFSVAGGFSLIAVFTGNIAGGLLPGIVMSAPEVVTLEQAYRLTLLLSIVPLVLSTGLVVLMPPDTAQVRAQPYGFNHVQNWDFIGKYTIVTATVGLGAGMIVVFFNIFFKGAFGLDESTIGLIFGVNTVVLAIGNFVAPALSDRLGKVRTVVVTEMLSVPFLLMLSWAPTLWWAVLAYVSRTALMNMAGPVSSAFFMERLDQEERATAIGVVRTGDSIARGVAANIGGLILASGLYRLPYVLVSGLYVLAIVMFYAFFHEEDEELRARSSATVTREFTEEELDIV